MTRAVAPAVIMLLASLAVTFIAGELLMRIYVRSRIIYDVEMTHYANALKIDSRDPLIGHEHRPGARATLMGVPVSINSDGLRDREYATEKSGKYRMLFLGDSLTFGWGVEESGAFPSLLEDRLSRRRPTEIVNFGIGNFNTEQEVRLLKLKGLKYRPDKVVVFWFINDAEPTPKASGLRFLGFSDLVTFLWSRASSLHNAYYKKTDYVRYYRSLYDENAAGWSAQKRAFLELKELSKAHGFDLQVVLIPELHNVSSYPFEKEHAAVAAYLSSLGIPHLDLAPLFSGYTDTVSLWVAPDDAHPNAAAHRLIAEYSEAFIDESAPVK